MDRGKEDPPKVVPTTASGLFGGGGGDGGGVEDPFSQLFQAQSGGGGEGGEGGGEEESVSLTDIGAEVEGGGEEDEEGGREEIKGGKGTAARKRAVRKRSSFLERKPIYLYSIWDYRYVAEEAKKLRGITRDQVWENPLGQEVFEDESVFVDSMLPLIHKYLGPEVAQERERILQATDAVNYEDFSVEGLGVIKKHILKSNWRVVLKWTGKYLINYNSLVGSDQKLCIVEAIQIILVRMIALMKLRLFEVAQMELEKMADFDSPVFRFECYPDTFPDRKGCMIPFTLRIIQAELPYLNDQPDLSFQKLYKLKYICTDMIVLLKQTLEEGLNGKDFIKDTVFISSEEDIVSAIMIWQQREVRTMYAIANQLLGLKDYRAAFSMYESLDAMDPHNPVTLSAIARINLLVGNVKSAQVYFEKAENCVNEAVNGSVLVNMNRGILNMALGLYEDASKDFSRAFREDTSNSMAANNLAICLMFTGNLKGAIASLEAVINEKQTSSIEETIIFNACTMYELETNATLERKQTLIERLSKYAGDSFNIDSFKLA
eukprot:Nk52_evm62s62 gene=Nk52_evmTU62s62